MCSVIIGAVFVITLSVMLWLKAFYRKFDANHVGVLIKVNGEPSVHRNGCAVIPSLYRLNVISLAPFCITTPEEMNQPGNKLTVQVTNRDDCILSFAARFGDEAQNIPAAVLSQIVAEICAKSTEADVVESVRKCFKGYGIELVV